MGNVVKGHALKSYYKVKLHEEDGVHVTWRGVLGCVIQVML
jgi:hypothetical protein